MTTTITITTNERNSPPGKVADAELHFADGILDGLKLIGFAVWQRRTGTGLNVTFPARQYSVNGERRSFALLRPSSFETSAANPQDRIRDLIVDAYQRTEQQPAITHWTYDEAGTCTTTPTPSPSSTAPTPDVTPATTAALFA